MANMGLKEVERETLPCPRAVMSECHLDKEIDPGKQLNGKMASGFHPFICLIEWRRRFMLLTNIAKKGSKIGKYFQAI